jgi:peroxiredoxin
MISNNCSEQRARTGIFIEGVAEVSLREALCGLYSQFSCSQWQARYQAAAKLVSEEERRRVLRVGDRVGAFELNDPDRGSVWSPNLLANGPLVITFYRGLWCRYCQQDLASLDRLMPEIRRLGASAIVVAHDLDKDGRARLREIDVFKFSLVDDTMGRLAERFGIRWPIEDEELIRRELGLDIAALRGAGPWIQPIQARFIVGTDGVIELSSVAFDHDQYGEPTEVLPVLTKQHRLI